MVALTTAKKPKQVELSGWELYIYLDICKIKDNIYKLEKETIIKCLDAVEKNFLELYNSKNNGGDDIGNN